MTKPNFDGRISLGNVITLISMIAGAALLWGQIDGRVSSVEVNQERHERELNENRIRLRAVETMGASQNARLDLILQALTEIKGRLEQFETLRRAGE